MVNKTLWFLLGIFVISLITLAIFFSDSSSSSFLGDTIAIVKVEGTITTQGSLFSAAANPESINKLLDRANEDYGVKAILLEINSPGGSAVASDEIARKVKGMDKPVVVWIGDVGASGGYWVASAGDEIVAHPLSITCSIGAIGIVGEFSELFEDLGINYTTVKSGEFKDLGSPYKPLESGEEAILQDIVDKINQDFVKEVATNRNMSIARVNKIADGRICLGKDALDYGLVDELGNKEDAIERAKELAGVEDANIVTLHSQETLFDAMFGMELKQAFYSMGMGIGHGLKGEENLRIIS